MGVEASQLQQVYRIETLVAVLAIVAVRLLNAQWLARTRGAEPVDPDVFGPPSVGAVGRAFWRAGGRVDPPQRAGGGGALGRIPGPPARRAAGLANHLARLAAVDVDV